MHLFSEHFRAIGCIVKYDIIFWWHGTILKYRIENNWKYLFRLLIDKVLFFFLLFMTKVHLIVSSLTIKSIESIECTAVRANEKFKLHYIKIKLQVKRTRMRLVRYIKSRQGYEIHVICTYSRQKKIKF